MIICVTGAGGFIGGWIVQQLLEAGHTVRATVRDPKHPKNAFLLRIAHDTGATNRLSIFEAFLERQGSFDTAFEGCEVVIHTAAVVQEHYHVDPVAEIIQPAILGVKHVVESCITKSVRRIVYTSSVSTITCGEYARPLSDRGRPFTEDMWVTHVSPTYGTYNYAKIEAERALWQSWDGELVSILPSWVLGPQQHARVTSSQQVARLVLNGEMPLLPPLIFDFVDVRDVAAAHVWAAVSPTAPQRQRLSCSGCMSVPLSHLAEVMNDVRPDLSVRTSTAPWALLWAMQWIDRRVTAYTLYDRTAPRAPVDNRRLQAAGFVMRYSDLRVTVKDLVESFERWGIREPPSRARWKFYAVGLAIAIAVMCQSLRMH